MKLRKGGTRKKWSQIYVAKKKWVKNKYKYNGTVYVLEIELEGRKLIKIGATSRTAKVRCLEILGEIETEYGYFPKTKLLKQLTCKDYYKVEAALHKRFKDKQYKTQHEFSGCSELFEITKADIMEVYDYEINQDYPADSRVDPVIEVGGFNGIS